MGLDIKPLIQPLQLKLEELSNRVIAIDAYNAIYQFLAIIRGLQGEYLTDSSGKVTSHLSGLFYRNVNLLSIGIKPVYVFDGKPPSLKYVEIEKRRQAKREATIKYVEALQQGRLEDARKYAQYTSVIQDYMIDDAKRLLDSLGIPHIDAPSEGEATAANLTITGTAYASASQDFDSLLFGAKRLIRNLTVSGRRKLPNKQIFVSVEPEIIALDQTLRALGVSREQLVDIGILIGTDFNPDGFRSIGPKKALKMIKENGRLEDIQEMKEKLKEIEWEKIREIFLQPNVVGTDKLDFRDPDSNGIIGFLCKERNFSEERVSSALHKLKKASDTRSQTLEQWFS
ncbi:MAG: flap endonuclease-1 [Nitrososphaerales archaeon]